MSCGIFDDDVQLLACGNAGVVFLSVSILCFCYIFQKKECFNNNIIGGFTEDYFIELLEMQNTGLWSPSV